MDWDKHQMGPGYDVCARCRGDKEAVRRRSKWCAACDAEMKSRRSTGATDATDRKGVTRRTRIIRRVK